MSTDTNTGTARTTDPAQRGRCLDSLLVDGLAVQTVDGRFALPGDVGADATRP